MTRATTIQTGASHPPSVHGDSGLQPRHVAQRLAARRNLHAQQNQQEGTSAAAHLSDWKRRTMTLPVSEARAALATWMRAQGPDAGEVMETWRALPDGRAQITTRSLVPEQH